MSVTTPFTQNALTRALYSSSGAIAPDPNPWFLKECFHYEEHCGLIWRARPLSHFSCRLEREKFNKEHSGFPVSVKKNPRIAESVVLDGDRYMIHNLIWVMNYGKYPSMHEKIVFLDGDMRNLSLKNLRIQLKKNALSMTPRLPTYAKNKFVRNYPTYWYLNECLSYNPNNGDLVWLKRPKNHFVSTAACNRVNAQHSGKIAGTETTMNTYGSIYRMVGLNGKQFLEHRLAWLLYYGVEPIGSIRHIDGDGLNNKISNLVLI